MLSRPEPVVEPEQPATGTTTPTGDRRVDAAYAGGVLLGAVLLVVTALRQPYSYDEISQITPYGSNNVVEIVTGTRQPPLDPLLGGLLQHLFGVGQLQQRLVPVLAGIGILVVASLWFRRLGLGLAGAWAVMVLATAPLAVRYGAYTRPYALPMLEMLLYAWAMQRWLSDPRRRWLVVLGAAAVSLPLTRVPEPMAFLGVGSVVLAFLAWRGRLTWAQVRPVVTIAMAVFVLLGLPLFFLLGAETQGTFYDPSPSGIIGRAGSGFHEIATHVVPLIGDSFPWWGTSLAVVVAALAFPASRRRLFGWPLWWAFLAAPVAFVLAYHLLNPFSFASLPYRSRAAYFFVPAYVLLTAAAATLVQRRAGLPGLVRAGIGLLLAAALVLQVPATATVVRKDAAPDFAKASALLTSRVPDDAIVLYDRPTDAGQSRQPFLGRPRYMGGTPYVANLYDLGKKPDALPQHGPVYVLVNGQCARPGRCELSRSPWTEQVPGWRLLATSERFSLYAPTDGQDGRPGVMAALDGFGRTLGPELGYVETLNAAALEADQGHTEKAHAMVQQLRDSVSESVWDRIQFWARLKSFPVPR